MYKKRHIIKNIHLVQTSGCMSNKKKPLQSRVGQIGLTRLKSIDPQRQKGLREGQNRVGAVEFSVSGGLIWMVPGARNKAATNRNRPTDNQPNTFRIKKMGQLLQAQFFSFNPTLVFATYSKIFSSCLSQLFILQQSSSSSSHYIIFFVLSYPLLRFIFLFYYFYFF